ncbi:hypothetical protein BDV12DRAFT_179126 [Aspergillus spectabilis]
MRGLRMINVDVLLWNSWCILIEPVLFSWTIGFARPPPLFICQMIPLSLLLVRLGRLVRGRLVVSSTPCPGFYVVDFETKCCPFTKSCFDEDCRQFQSLTLAISIIFCYLDRDHSPNFIS